MLPAGFLSLLEESLGHDAASGVAEHLGDAPSVSVRVNPAKTTSAAMRRHFGDNADEAVVWSTDAFYLKERPSFTMDPLFHAGAYYVQEASSMYVGRILERLTADGSVSEGMKILDLCAAPGGKTTDILSHMPSESLLVSNEVMRNRATVLAGNVARWGCPNVLVTNNDPADFKGFDGWFDLVVVDAPCSGEGMFRKDDEAVAEWSPDNVNLCASRQRRILADIWPALADGGYLIYSTCTFNHYEDEDNAAWIASEMGAELLEQRHFLPGADRGEGFYCALLRKNGASVRNGRTVAGNRSVRPVKAPECPYVRDGFRLIAKGDLIKAYPAGLFEDMQYVESRLRVIHSGIAAARLKGRDLIPEADLALSTVMAADAFPKVELSCGDALRFLAKEPLAFPGEPKGYLLLTYCGMPLGFVKNLGNRSNNLHPVSRRILKDIK